MQYETYTTKGYWEKKIYFYLNNIIKKKDIFYSHFKEQGFRLNFRNSLFFGEFLKYIVLFFLDEGDKILEINRPLPEFKHGPEKAQEKTFYDLKVELESRRIHEDLRDLILALWAFKIRKTSSEFESFFNSLQGYSWDELNRLRIIIPKKKKERSSVFQKIKV